MGDIYKELPMAEYHVAEKLNQGFKHPVVISFWYLDEKIIAQASWWGHLITYNVNHLLNTDLEFLVGPTLKHELTHCLFLQYKLGVAYKTPYHLRFHENAAYYIGYFPGALTVFKAHDEEKGRDASLKILRRALELKKEGRSTGEAKDEACREATGWDWDTFCNIYVDRAYREAPRYSLVKYEDYEAWKEAKEKREKEEAEKKEEAETKPKKT